MNQASIQVGKGRSFPELDGKDEQKTDPQQIIRSGYKSCTRRTYLIRFKWKHIESEGKRLANFADHGVICHDSRIRSQVYKALIQLGSESKGSNVYALDFGLTFSGLQSLGVCNEILDVFRRKSPAFTDGAAIRASQHLGDTGLSAVSNWDSIYQNDSVDGGIHLVVIAHFPRKLSATDGSTPIEDDQAVIAFEQKLACAALLVEPFCHLPNLPLQGHWIEVAVPISNEGYEHFGYKDGLTKPAYKAKQMSPEDRISSNTHALGEILLGHARNDGDNLFGDLGMPHKKHPNIDPQTGFEPDHAINFFKNSSFGVLRKIEQNVDAFEAWVEKYAEKKFLNDQQLPALGGMPESYESSKIWIKSKLLGRTPNGKLLKPDMDLKEIGANPELHSDDENRGFKRRDSRGELAEGDDSKGLGCPFSSHIRRMNPRDDPVTPFIFRPLLRRGMTYTHSDSKGLLGLFFCADLVKQFEHLVGVWAQGRVMGIPDSSDCRDPLIGNHEPQRNRLVLASNDQKPQRDIVLEFDTPFVRTRGCAYLWFPSLRTLGSLSEYFNAKY